MIGDSRAGRLEMRRPMLEDVGRRPVIGEATLESVRRAEMGRCGRIEVVQSHAEQGGDPLAEPRVPV